MLRRFSNRAIIQDKNHDPALYNTIWILFKPGTPVTPQGITE